MVAFQYCSPLTNFLVHESSWHCVAILIDHQVFGVGVIVSCVREFDALSGRGICAHNTCSIRCFYFVRVIHLEAIPGGLYFNDPVRLEE